MKKFIFLLLLPFISFSQNIQWQWAKNVNDTLTPMGYDNISATANGSFYIFNNFDTVSAIKKFDSAGNLTWTSSIHGKEHIKGICASDSNIYICGSFTYTLLIGNLLLSSKDSTTDVFIAKFSSNGTAIWAKRMGGIYEDRGNSLCVDINENVYVTGFYTGNPDFEGTPIMGSNEMQMFVLKIDNSGNLLFSKSGQSLNNSGSSNGTKINIDNLGNIYTTGEFSYFKIDSINITGGGGPIPAVFLIKFNSAGIAVWGKQVLAESSLQLFSFSLDTLGNIFISGYVSSWAYGNTYTQKYNSGGVLIWNKSLFAQGQGNSSVQGIASSGTNAFVLGGYSNGYWGTDPTEFIIKYDAVGNQLIRDTLAKTFVFFNIIKDSNEDFIVLGSVNSPTKLGNDSIYPVNNKIFIAKFKEVSIATSINKQEKSNAIKLYPNPGSGIYNIELSKEGETVITVSDLLGNSLLTQSSGKSQQQIDLTKYAKGIYFVEVATGSQKQTMRISNQ